MHGVGLLALVLDVIIKVVRYLDEFYIFFFHLGGTALFGLHLVDVNDYDVLVFFELLAAAIAH